ncbi:MAG: SusD/RagB family nutrient-binding outer membrane lipoprotein [Prevotella sp.]|jgi:tetratricopeptide (TPR) repeat protein|nr:SusD/RagB family nutrient-binding outer membrane lipoprotein [Prevotella sp.]MCI1781280.1 SusD/RagB family nutrient-binding outer membrane lipoprotein [Prevotella sp.]MCI1802539.1 SusD/RagB family nutrient-binding outer membrane lipoprotein [Prevotella sp.]MCI1816598.1 SusD/RagB family nutrient-binding outer membrane lipoprotein [Prevotella sp.]MCI1849168.1 SusD/RagB family nutrient-binding outer membrane lipoprotein [Prevotella sp.]
MKRTKYILIGIIVLLSTASCSKYLDVNTDPDNPTSDNAAIKERLPWIENYYAYAWGSASMRACTIAGLLTQTSTTNSNGLLAAWNPSQVSSTTAYQNIYLGAGVNIDPLITRAKEENAYYYEGAGYCLKAMCFMTMLDLYGECPMSEAFTGKTNPAYDDGKTIYNACINCLDSAIVSFQKEQPTSATKLSDGDIWNGGDKDKWLKLCYGLKARYLLRLSKRSDLFNPQEILDALSNGPQSNDDNTSVENYNVEGDETNFTVGDPYQTSPIWDYAAYGSSQRETKWYINLLTNQFTGGSGVIDPRMSKLVPAMMKDINLSTTGKILSYDWARDAGVDMMNSDIRQNGGPINATFATSEPVNLTYEIDDASALATFVASMQKIHTVTISGNKVTVTYAPGATYCNTTDYRRAGDTIYVNMRSNSLSTSGRSATNMYYYPASEYDFVGGTGTFYARPNSDTDLLTYSEMCFIKAEVYFRLGDKAKALAAYKEGIQANFDRMQTRLNAWKAAGSVNPDEMPMNEEDISAYMNSQAVCQNASALTMADIMRQKMISMGINLEVWNDMRRFNYSAGNIGSFGIVYPDYKRPAEFTATNKITGQSPTDLTYWFQRFQQSSIESSYNLIQLEASNKLAMNDAIWSCPVWWACSSDEEYYGYIK